MLLSRKLPLVAIAITVISIFAASATGIWVGTDALREAEIRSLGAVADSRRNRIQAYLESIKSDLMITSKRADVAEAVTSFDDAWSYIEGDAMRVLQKRYIHDNPHPVGKKQLFEDAENDAYDATHRTYHATLRQIQEINGYDDLYLINMKGDVVYSVFKELDYATNLNNGKWSKTDLANIFRDVIKGKDPARVYFRDFRDYAPSNNVPTSFIAKAVQSQGETVGVLVYQMPLDNIKSILHSRTGLGETGETLLVDRSGLLIIDSMMTKGDDALKVRLTSPLLGKADSKKVTTGELTGYRDMTSFAAFASVNFSDADWVVTSVIDQDEAMAGAESMKMSILFIGIVLIGVAILVSVLFVRTITRPIDRIVGRMKQLAAGDTSFDGSDMISSDEIGQIAQSVLEFRDAAIKKSKHDLETEQQRAAQEAEAAAEKARQTEQAMAVLGEGLVRLSEGDMTCTIEQSFDEQFDQLRRDFNEAVDKLQTTIHSVHSGSWAVNSGSKQISTATDELSAQTERNAASLEETATALAKILSTVNATTERAQKGQAAVVAAKTDAEDAGKVALRAMEAMRQIKSSSNEISQITGVIDDIAFQTNLLALNAGVEAARAGEAGRGFAVVASEVRGLAQRSADAAKTINELISTSSSEVDSGVKLVEQTGDALERIVSRVGEISEEVIQIAEDARNQEQGLHDINQAVTQMDQNTQNNAVMAEQTTAACRSLLEESNRLQGLVSHFNLDDRASGDPVRSALQKSAPHVFNVPAAAGSAGSGFKQPPLRVVAGSSSSASSRARAGSSARVGASAGASAGISAIAGANANDDGWEEF